MNKPIGALVAVMLLVFALFLIPRVFQNVFAIENLLNHEIDWLKNAAIALGIAGVLYFLFRKYFNHRISLMLVGLGVLLFVEFGFRAVAHFTFSDSERWALETDGLRTYSDYTAYAGHPFLHFTKRPLIDAASGDSKNIYEYNKLGFNDVDRSYEKPENEYRIACLGGSTTERWYPQIMNGILDSVWTHESKPVVLNFGVSSWTSAHSMVNYLLNVVEFEPDMLIIHHGWNESEVRNSPKEAFRPDYSHAFKYFHEPVRNDALIVRTSLLYRYLKNKLGWQEGWMFLDRATMNRGREMSDAGFTNTLELEPYKRNLKVMIDQALINGTKVILTTMPYDIAFEGKVMNIRQCNSISRLLKAEYQAKITLVDLDSLMTGTGDSVFIDEAHVSGEGREIKAQHLANAIIEELMDKSNDSVTLKP